MPDRRDLDRRARARSRQSASVPLEPVAHKFDVMALDSGHVQTAGGRARPEQSGVGCGDRQGDAAPAWTRCHSAVHAEVDPVVAPDPRGTRLFAVGMNDGPESSDRGRWSGSTGIWVFDPTLRSSSIAGTPPPRTRASVCQGTIAGSTPSSAGRRDTDGNPSGGSRLALGPRREDRPTSRCSWPISVPTSRSCSLPEPPCRRAVGFEATTRGAGAILRTRRNGPVV